MYCLAYAEKVSIYLLCASEYIVSNAKEFFPEPETPYITTNLFLGIFKEIFLRLLTFAPLILISVGSDMFFELDK